MTNNQFIFFISVTIFGGSSGGASVTYLMASPLAEGTKTNFKIDDQFYMVTIWKLCFRFIFKCHCIFRHSPSILGSIASGNGQATSDTIGQTFQLLHTERLVENHRLFTYDTSEKYVGCSWWILCKYHKWLFTRYHFKNLASLIRNLIRIQKWYLHQLLSQNYPELS